MTERSPAPLRVGILALDGVMLSSVAGPSDALRVAGKLASIRDPINPVQFESAVVSARGQSEVQTSAGISIGGLQGPREDLDVLIVPGLMHECPSGLTQQLAAYTPEYEYLHNLHRRGTIIAATCSGTFMFAASGLLDGHRATTSWWLASSFRSRFPRVTLEADQMMVKDGPLVTTGAATSIYNYILELVAEHGGEDLAQQTGRMLVIDRERQSQAPYVSLAMMERPRHSLSERAERYLQRELHQEMTVAKLAEHCGISERSLLRHYRSHHGMTPLEHIQHLRVERAKALLETTHLSFEEIVERCGYSDVSSFRKLFKRASATTPSDYRERFRLRAH
ncbi:MAG: helix-turn-helix domain-containing protein [Xanthomonadales bacterium]|nr:helix-turn-helix domain-containing protein [Xanthomonadales bacterium]